MAITEGNLFVTSSEPVYINSSDKCTNYFTVRWHETGSIPYTFNTINNSITMGSQTNGSQSESLTYMEFQSKKTETFVFSCTLTFNYPTDTSRRGYVKLYLNNTAIGTYDPLYHKTSTSHQAHISIPLKHNDILKIAFNYSTATVIMSHMFINAPNPYYTLKTTTGNTALTVNDIYYAKDAADCIYVNKAQRFSQTAVATIPSYQNAKIIANRINTSCKSNAYIYYMSFYDEVDGWSVSEILHPAASQRETLYFRYGKSFGVTLGTGTSGYAITAIHYSLVLLSPVIGSYEFDYEIEETPILKISCSTGVTSFNVVVKNTSGSTVTSLSSTNRTSYSEGIPAGYTYEITPTLAEGYFADTITGTMENTPKEYSLTGVLGYKIIVNNDAYTSGLGGDLLTMDVCYNTNELDRTKVDVTIENNTFVAYIKSGTTFNCLLWKAFTYDASAGSVQLVGSAWSNKKSITVTSNLTITVNANGDLIVS